MRIAMAIFRAIPENGMRNCLLRIAEAARRRGHEIIVYTSEWKEESPDFIRVVRFNIHSSQYHKRTREFFFRLADAVREDKPAAVLGFNRGPGLDYYFTGGNCFVFTEKQNRSGVYRLFNREYATRAALEQEVFSPASGTGIFYFGEEQKKQFIRTFHTPAERFIRLSPSANQDCRRTADYEFLRAEKRRQLSAGEDQLVLVQVAANMMQKGVDRTILATASLPEEIRRRVRLCLIGRDIPKLHRLAAELGLDGQILFTGALHDIRDYLFAADLMVHPARFEVTGPMLLEALDAGLPVLCTDTCGYADYVTKSHAGGTVSGKGFDQMELNASLLSFLWNAGQLKYLSEYALDFMKHHDTFAYADMVVDVLEQKGSHAVR